MIFPTKISRESILGEKYALLSVSNKAEIGVLGSGLVKLGYTLLSTGGTAKALMEAGLPVTPVASHTGSPEIMNGRVKTLHPKIHGGILGDRVTHLTDAQTHDISWIDVVAVNLYPFESTVSGDVTMAEAIEKIDIGGPTMVRAAAKSHKHVLVLVDPSDYGPAIETLSTGNIAACARLRLEMSLKAFRHTARYDGVISDWLGRASGDLSLPTEGAIGLRRLQECRYGENPHQTAAFYADADQKGRSLARLVQHQGKDLSFNNIADLDGALRAVFEYAEPAVAVIKHMNPCGMATAATPAEAFVAALAGDPVSAYGGIVAFNRPVGLEEVQAFRRARTFFEVLAAPGFSKEALEALSGRKKMRVVELPSDWADTAPSGYDARRVMGGWLLQDWDLGVAFEPKVVSERQPTPAEMRALLFAWGAVKHVKSNAIVLAKSHDTGAQLNGVGAGQMSRVDAVRIAVDKATSDVHGAVLASDAFFPFADGIKEAADAGVLAIIQPGGSIRDDEVIAAANAAGMVMVFTGVRHFRH
jgi:phosphoribosylaminoimidazolecarboxamide formyltransferase/IMP cyclohydrolase